MTEVYRRPCASLAYHWTLRMVDEAAATADARVIANIKQFLYTRRDNLPGETSQRKEGEKKKEK